MAKVITFAIQKGGVSKTSTTGITAALLAQEGHRVLVCDMDSQGNVTQLLTKQNIYDFEGETILEAIEAADARPYIKKTQIPGIDILTANDVLITMARWLYIEDGKGRNPLTLLEEALETVRDQYDYILVDTPPNLGEQTQTSLAAADAVVVLFEPSEWCFDAVKRFMRVANNLGNKIKKEIKIAGILRNLTDIRRGDVRDYNQAITMLFPDLVFETVIKRIAPTGRIGLYGLTQERNSEVKAAMEPYVPFVKELKERL